MIDYLVLIPFALLGFYLAWRFRDYDYPEVTTDAPPPPQEETGDLLEYFRMRGEKFK